MKRTMTKLLALALVLVCTVFACVSCGKPEFDLEEAKKNLEDAEYEVSYVEDASEYMPNLASRLYAEDEDGNEISIMIYNDAKSAKLAYKAAKASNEQAIDNLKLEIKQLKNLVKKYDDKLESAEIDEYNDEIKELQEELDELKEVVIGRSGKKVYYATSKDVIKASKGK